jgi:hypothetical protein
MNTETNLQPAEAQTAAPAVDFELRSLKETWSSVLNANSLCGSVGCVTITCVCCDPGTGRPQCPQLPPDN